MDFPLKIESLCKSLGVDLIPLTRIVSDTSLTEEDIFSIWGNEDGVIQRCGNRHRISYNDTVRLGRSRFTLCEELSHMILGHTKDSKFSLSNQQYDLSTYHQYEEEARIGAGILLCNPKFFYFYQSLLQPNLLANICKITPQCARIRYDILKKYKSEITSNKVYPFLPLPEFKIMRIAN